MTAVATVRQRYRALPYDEDSNGSDDEVDCARWSGAQCTARCGTYPL